MREILFRCKRSDNGEWVEGQYYKREYCYGDPSVRHYIITSTETLDYDYALEYYEVDPKTVGQYIGLTDMNDKKIFEGDVLERERLYMLNERIVISYSDSSFAYTSLVSAFSRDISDPIDDCEYGINTELYKIVGNVYDNPELLER